MQHRQLGTSGLRVSALAMGGLTCGESDGFLRGISSSDAEARRLLDAALDAGITMFDTADAYHDGRSEQLIGAWAESRRDRVLLATKCGFPMGYGSGVPDPNAMGLSRKHVIDACEASLRRLRTDYIDLYQVHMQDGSVPVEETLDALGHLVAQGKVRYIGCSNYTGYRLVESLWAADRRDTQRFASVQLQWSLAVRDAEREVVPACRAFGLGVTVWSPLAHGFLTGKYARGAAAPDGSRLAVLQVPDIDFDTDRMWGIADTVARVAKRHACSSAAVALAWLLACPEVSSVIIGARSVGQLEDNLTALDVELTAEDHAELDAASAIPWGYPYDYIGRHEPW